MRSTCAITVAAALLILALPTGSRAQLVPVVPQAERGRIDAERAGTLDGANIRTSFWNYGMVGDFPRDPANVDLSVFHSVEVPKGSGMNYGDGITPFVLAKIKQNNGLESYIMETGFRERQGLSPLFDRVMRFEPRPGFFQADPTVNRALSPAISNDPRTWPGFWPDKLDDAFDPGWPASWNGYFGKRPAADLESFSVMDDDFYDAWDYYPDSRDSTRRGLGLRIEVRGFQWANPQASNVIFWHYDITNESTTDYDDNIIFGLYMDSGVGGSGLSCDGIFESDDDNAFFDKASDLNLVYTWDKGGHGVDLSGQCGTTGYLGYAYLETPGAPFDALDNDDDGMLNEVRDGGPGQKIVGQENIRAHAAATYDLAAFEQAFGVIEKRPAYKAGVWWTGDEDLDWDLNFHDVGQDGVAETGDPGELDGMPTLGEPYFDRTDIHESDMIGLTGFKMNRIRVGQGNPNPEVDGVLFFTNDQKWPERLYKQFTAPTESARFDSAVASNYNIGFLFASGPFVLKAGQTERFSLALAYGSNLTELRENVRTVRLIYDSNYQFAVPPPLPTLSAEAGDGFVTLTWDDKAEHGFDPVTFENDFEGYRIYRSTDPSFLDPRVITNATGTAPIGNGRPIAQFDLIDGRTGFSDQTVEGTAYWLGEDTGITHVWTDTTVTNGQLYYYAVTSYDFGSDSLGFANADADTINFYPSENAISVTRTARGGTILAQNVVEVRPNRKVSGFTRAESNDVVHEEGRGDGSVQIEIVNSEAVPDDHEFKIRFNGSADSIRATSYYLTDETSGKEVLTRGTDLAGEGSGPVGLGILPIIDTPETVLIDTLATGFDAGSPTNASLTVTYQTGGFLSLPINRVRPGFPDDITIMFYDEIVDTSLFVNPTPALPVKYEAFAHAPDRDFQLDTKFFDTDGDGTLSAPNEFIDIITYGPDRPTLPIGTWRIKIAARDAEDDSLIPPAGGDVFRLRLERPFGPDDLLSFRTSGEFIDESVANRTEMKPYVVPNPYVGSASFEPERFAISGRGERRIEFRGIARNATVRIYTVLGDLVQTLTQNGSDDAFVAWNLRTRDNLDVAPGLYIYHVDGGDAGTATGKFAIIK
ncbi:MAG: T9SS type A sorting domain-containing protein [Gemmatimonadetes bacterium]|nr:T9SS type A sorting domain-containing protein [Gemmatimonadota bacterium]